MSTFPTAFWHTKRRVPAGGSAEPRVINWETGVYWSYGNNGSTSPDEYDFPIRTSPSNFPFHVTSVNGWEEDFNQSVDSNTWQGDITPPTPYFGWYLTGGYGIEDTKEYDLQDYHRAEPWIVGDNEIKIFFEADYSTASDVETPNPYNTYWRDEIYNQYIQSGSATGSFSLNTTTNLTVKVSGLGEDYDSAGLGAPSYDSMILYLNNGSTSELICSGAAPQDGRNVRSLGDNNYDMQQVKLYAGNDLSTIVNTTDSPQGEARGNASELVNQLTRDIGYTTTNGIGTFTKNSLSAGDYKIIIEVSTVDANYSSGAFYGFTFSFS